MTGKSDLNFNALFKIREESNPPQAPPYEGRGYKSIALEYSACFTGNAVLAPRLVVVGFAGGDDFPEVFGACFVFFVECLQTFTGFRKLFHHFLFN